ncbi:hypothetical protein BPNPMPFG_000308 [Mesorhizobium sp. AR07]|uniref:hypothetical protein n=1 Tax=Mesorhizobium sp. AR07 TaxID=2865838 RepID=UPI00215EB37C|nr:hypothetical protein [Mesorhizobium sp. AR07]UVK44843.1 hypothetical protein BPNPMPFG_000308 [Mesorhizobium sp. AR07]
MSAFYCVAYTDHIEILTDGAFYHPDGTLITTLEKVWRSPCLPVAIVGRGSCELQAFAETVLDADNASVDTVFDRAAALAARLNEIERTEQFEAVVAGISETHGPLMIYFNTYQAYPQFDPFKPYVVGPVFGGGSVPAAEDIIGLDIAYGLAVCGVQLFEAMRKVPGPNPTRPDFPDVYGIGGHVDLTVIDAEGAKTTRLHTWPEDVVGQKIMPGGVLREAA